jgi:hypothetical protein
MIDLSMVADFQSEDLAFEGLLEANHKHQNKDTKGGKIFQTIH